MDTNASKQAIAGIQSSHNIVNRWKQLYPVEYHAKPFPPHYATSQFIIRNCSQLGTVSEDGEIG